MTSVDGPDGESNQHEDAEDTPGWGLPSRDPRGS